MQGKGIYPYSIVLMLLGFQGARAAENELERHNSLASLDSLTAEDGILVREILEAARKKNEQERERGRHAPQSRLQSSGSGQMPLRRHSDGENLVAERTRDLRRLARIRRIMPRGNGSDTITGLLEQSNAFIGSAADDDVFTTATEEPVSPSGLEHRPRDRSKSLPCDLETHDEGDLVELKGIPRKTGFVALAVATSSRSRRRQGTPRPSHEEQKDDSSVSPPPSPTNS